MRTRRTIGFTVFGVPVPQGSKMPYGGEANPHLSPWRSTVAEKAAEATNEPLLGPVEVTAEFVFPRPKGHFRTGRRAGELKDSAPYWHTIKPDLDKLMRAIGDALSGTVLHDDSQIATWMVCKRYVQ